MSVTPIDLGKFPEGPPPTPAQLKQLREIIRELTDTGTTSATPPSAPYEGMLWYDGGSLELKVRRGGQWVTGGGQSTAVVDRLDSTAVGDALSANMGRVLSGLIDDKADETHDHTASDITNFAAAADLRITAQKAAANGLATLGPDKKVPAIQLPTATAGVTVIDNLTSSSATAALSAKQGKALNDGKAPTIHTHSIGNVNGLQGELSDLQDAIYDILNPAVAPGASLSVNSTLREYGASKAYTLTWSVTKNTNPITGITVDGAVITPTGNSQSSTKTGNFANSNVGTQSRSMSVTDGNLVTNRNASVEYRYRVYHSTSIKNSSFNSTEIRAFGTAAKDSMLRTSRAMTLSNHGVDVAPGGTPQYLVFVFPVTFGTPSFAVNGAPNTAFTKVQSNLGFVNAEGATVQVDIWTSDNPSNGTIDTLTIS